MKNKGITLVALVITIILLLILAGIAISQLTGSGLFEKARLAEEKSKEAQNKEDETLVDYENKIGQYVDGSRETVTIDKEEYEALKDAVYNKSAITVYSTESIAVNANQVKVDLNSSSSGIKCSTGTGLTIEDGGIKIGKGISNVLVSASGHIISKDQASYSIYIYLNDTMYNIDSTRASATTDGVTTATYLLNVQEGDIIYLYNGNTSGGGTFTNNYLTVAEY